MTPVDARTISVPQQPSSPQPSSPDALSHPAASQAATTTATQEATQEAKKDTTQDQAATQDSATAEPHGKPRAKKRVVSRTQRAFDDNAGDPRQRGPRPIYDYSRNSSPDSWRDSWRDSPRGSWSDSSGWGRDRSDDAGSSGAALSGMKPPRALHAARNGTTTTRYVHSRRAPPDRWRDGGD
jgi:hypothetical protein